jgi:membrane protease YdiL (CAAX protease family)
MLNVWAIILILWSFYRAYFRTDLPIWFDELIAKPLIFLLPIYYYIKKIEKQSFFTALDLQSKRWKIGLMYGVGIGMLFFMMGYLSLIVRGDFSREVVSIQFVGTFLFYLIIAFATSVSEEVVSRGFVLKRLYAESNKPFMSVFYASFLFFFLHIPIIFSNPVLEGGLLFQVMITDILLSFAVSFIYLNTKSLYVPIFIHAFYNLSIYLFL